MRSEILDPVILGKQAVKVLYQRIARPLGAIYLKKSGIVRRRTGVLPGRVTDILKKGVEQGKIRRGIDPMQLNHSIAALGFYYRNNRFTNSQIYNFDHMTPAALAA